jgi:hypothetical protein
LYGVALAHTVDNLKFFKHKQNFGPR